MPRRRMKVSRLISPILTVNLVAIATAFEWSEKVGQISNLWSNTYHTVKNCENRSSGSPERINMNSPILHILTLRLAAMERPMNHWKRGSNRQSTIKFLPYGENSAKIGPVDPEFSLLKEKKEIYASRTYSPRGICMPRGLAKSSDSFLIVWDQWRNGLFQVV